MTILKRADNAFLLVFAAYIYTMSPQIFWRDSAEFVATAYSLSVSHPAGSPTYNLLAKIFTLIPIGDIAFKVNLFSAFCAAITVLLIFKILEVIFEVFLPPDTDKLFLFSKKFLSGLFACFFGFSLAFWRWSIVAEVYSLQDCFIALMIYLSLLYAFRERDGSRSPHNIRLVFLVAFLFTLSLGAHMTNAFFLPALGIFFILINRNLLRLKELSWTFFFGLLGFSAYLYLPVRSVGAAILKLGSPSNLERFWDHITASRVMEGANGVISTMSDSYRLLPKQIWQYIFNLEEQLSLLGIVLGIIGLIYLAKKDWKSAIFTVLIFLGNIIFFIRTWTSAFGFMPSYLIYSIWMGLGGMFIVSLLYQSSMFRDKNHIIKQSLCILFIVSFLFQFTINLSGSLQANNLDTFYTTRTQSTNILDSLKYRSVLITNYSVPQFPIWYLQIAENRASDLITIPLEEFADDTVIEKLLTNEKDYYNIYWVGSEKTELFKDRLLPNGLVFEFNLQDNESSITDDDFARHLKYRLGWEKELKEDQYADDFESYAEIHKINAEIYYYYALRDDLDNALREFGSLVEVNPNSATLNMYYGSLWAEKKELKKAASYFKKALSLNKNLSRGRFFIFEKSNAMLAVGITLLVEERYEDAVKILTNLAAGTPFPFTAHYYLGLALMGDNRREEALREFKLASSLRPADVEILGKIRRVQGMIDMKRSHTN
ncbi:MAG: DUF2723 domain-containing protein [Pseudomonadota bacterium]